MMLENEIRIFVLALEREPLLQESRKRAASSRAAGARKPMEMVTQSVTATPSCP